MNLTSTASVIYETAILDSKGRVVSSRPPKRNLLLDSGLDLVAAHSWFALTNVCVLGGGTLPTRRNSGSVELTVAGGTVTASAGFFEANDVGRLIKADTGEEFYVTGYTSATEVEATAAPDIASPTPFTVWYVNVNGHGQEIRRTTNKSNGTGENQSTWDGSTRIAEIKRTFIFPAEVNPVTYREVGWAQSTTVAPNLLGRDLIPGAGDSLSPGQQYKVTLRLLIELPNVFVPQPFPNIGGAFNTTGQFIVGSIGGNNAGLHGHAFGGVFTDAPRFWEPSAATVRALPILAPLTIPSSTEFSSSGSIGGLGNNLVNLSRNAYAPGSRMVEYTGAVSTTRYNGSWHALYFGQPLGSSAATNAVGTNFLIVFDAPQTKSSTHRVDLVFRKSWGRELTN